MPQNPEKARSPLCAIICHFINRDQTTNGDDEEETTK